MSQLTLFNFSRHREVPCSSRDDCRWNWACVGEARGCPMDGVHEKCLLRRKLLQW